MLECVCVCVTERECVCMSVCVRACVCVRLTTLERLLITLVIKRGRFALAGSLFSSSDETLLYLGAPLRCGDKLGSTCQTGKCGRM